jgi:peroxiredoxin
MRSVLATVLLAFPLLLSCDASAGSLVGKAAPDFTLTSLDGATFKLSEQAGKTVVLEWFNPGCPFVQEAHGTGALSAAAAPYLAKGVVWVAINSGAPGKEGHGLELNKESATKWAMTHPVLLDEKGTVGKQYNAVTTPQLVVVDPAGKVAYAGALDNAPLGKVQGGGARVPWFTNALDEVLAGKPVSLAETKPWGCSVKY